MMMKRKFTALLLSAVIALQPGGFITSESGTAAVKAAASTAAALSADTAEVENAWENGQVVAL